MHELDACAPCTVNAQRMPEKERIELIIDFVSTLSKNGITATTDMAVLPTAIPVTEELKAVKRLEEEGRFNLRLNLYPPLGTTADFGVVKEYDSLFTSDKLRVAGLKAFVDGVHGNHTALVIEPYNDMPGHCGESFYSHEMYMSQVLAANRAGFGVKLHCCGEGAVEWALDAYENANKQLPNNSVRNSIEHVEALRSEQAIRFTANDVTATMQPLHLMYEGDILDTILGAERAKNQYAIKTMIDEGINVAFSSDYPVAEFNPFINIYFAVTRCDREGNPVEKNSTQAIGVADAIKAYTLGSAYCMGMEQKIGTLEEGKLADILVLDRNLFTSKPQDILDTNVELTMVDGVIAHNDLFKEA